MSSSLKALGADDLPSPRRPAASSRLMSLAIVGTVEARPQFQEYLDRSAAERTPRLAVQHRVKNARTKYCPSSPRRPLRDFDLRVLATAPASSDRFCVRLLQQLDESGARLRVHGEPLTRRRRLAVGPLPLYAQVRRNGSPCRCAVRPAISSCAFFLIVPMMRSGSLCPARGPLVCHGSISFPRDMNFLTPWRARTARGLTFQVLGGSVAERPHCAFLSKKVGRSSLSAATFEACARLISSSPREVTGLEASFRVPSSSLSCSSG